jgi:TrfA protein
MASQLRVSLDIEMGNQMSEPERIDVELDRALESLSRAIKDNPHKEETKPAPPAKIIQLPLWPESRQGVPNAVVRSALFPALNFQQGRPYLEQQEIASVRGVTVFFSGKRFDQSDLDVYLELLDLARQHPLGTECTFTAHGLLKRLGRQTGNSDHQWLHAVLIRLRGGTVDITDHKKRYFGGLIEGGFKDELTRHYTISINPKFAALFGFGMWASIDRDQRRALGRNATAKALHVYYSSHVTPGYHSFDTLAAIVGLNNSNKRDERARLIAAHERLKETGFLRGYSVSEDGTAIKADVCPTPGQAHHIVKKIIKQRGKKRAAQARDSADGSTG